MRKKQVFVEFEGGKVEITYLSKGTEIEEVNGLGNEGNPGGGLGNQGNPGGGLGNQGNPGGRLQVGKLIATVSTTEVSIEDAESLDAPSVSVILNNRKQMLE